MEDKSKIPILKVGDKIRIKSKEWFDSQDKTAYGGINPPNGQAIYFRPLMSTHCGKICTIKEITSHSTNTVKVNENDYNWGSWMFDIVESAHEYKVGDKVRIKSKEWFNSQPKDRDGDIPSPNENGLYFTTKMSNFCSEVFTIESIDDFCIYLEENNEGWKPWMFDPVEEEPQYKVGDKVIINSIDWYNANKDIHGSADDFIEDMTIYCGKEVTISSSYKEYDKTYYKFKEIGYTWSSLMFSPALSAKTGDIISGFREATKEELEQLRVAHSERWAKLIAISFISKDNNSQSNFSKFDLSKVMYKSKIIK